MLAPVSLAGDAVIRFAPALPFELDSMLNKQPSCLPAWRPSPWIRERRCASETWELWPVRPFFLRLSSTCGVEQSDRRVNWPRHWCWGLSWKSCKVLWGQNWCCGSCSGATAEPGWSGFVWEKGAGRDLIWTAGSFHYPVKEWLHFSVNCSVYLTCAWWRSGSDKQTFRLCSVMSW